jgi:hypothetical protein
MSKLNLRTFGCYERLKIEYKLLAAKKTEPPKAALLNIINFFEKQT